MEKTDEQIAKEREAVAAMTNAKANMTNALDRIVTLERALYDAKSNISTLKGYIPPAVYTYSTGQNAPKTCVSVADDAIAAIAKVLG